MWDKSNGIHDFYSADKDSWLFSFDKKTHLKLKPLRVNYSKKHHWYCFNRYGAGDLTMNDGKYYLSAANTSKLGSTYGLTTGIVKGTLYS